jgi:hypothetical protein
MITDLSFLVECAAPTTVKESSLVELTGFTNTSFIAYATKKLGSIKITDLKPEDFKDRPEILEKYFRHNNVRLDRFHIPELNNKQYAALAADDMPKNRANLKLETATQYYVRKMRLTAVAKDLNCTVKQLDLTDYIWDERYYIRYNLIDNMRVVDDWYRDDGKDDRYSTTSYDAYIRNDPRVAVVNTDLFDELYSFCISAVRQRKVMLLGKVDRCLSTLRNIIEYTYGFTENPTKQMMATLKGYKTYFEELLKDKEMHEFLTNNNDITVYGMDTSTHSDYVETYRAVIRSLVSGSDEDISTFSDILTGISDPYIDEIYEVLPEVKYKPWEYDNATEDVDE